MEQAIEKYRAQLWASAQPCAVLLGGAGPGSPGSGWW